MPKVSIGRVVHYTLSEHDAEAINRRRSDFVTFAAHTHPHEPGQPAASGHIAHVGNNAAAGDTYPAMIVRDWGGCVNLQVHLDGNDTYWATSRSEGDKRATPGTWSWPALD